MCRLRYLGWRLSRLNLRLPLKTERTEPFTEFLVGRFRPIVRVFSWKYLKIFSFSCRTLTGDNYGKIDWVLPVWRDEFSKLGRYFCGKFAECRRKRMSVFMIDLLMSQSLCQESLLWSHSHINSIPRAMLLRVYGIPILLLYTKWLYQ